ncbi:hypothetical protein VaNZ11_013384, partial [Volvox africanus]
MSWRSRGSGLSAWRQCLAPLRQEAAVKGYVDRQNLQAALESLRTAATEFHENEFAEDLPFLVQQLLGWQPSTGTSISAGFPRDNAPQVALCRLLNSLTASRTISLHRPTANLVLSALRQWSDGALYAPKQGTSESQGSNGVANSASNPVRTAATSSSVDNSRGISGCGNAAMTADSPESQAQLSQPPSSKASLPLEAMTALAALLPDHLGILPEHERAAQLAALLSLLVPQPRGVEGSRGRGAAEHLEMQILALTALGACCSRTAGSGGSSGSGLTTDEIAALLSAAVSLLQSCASRSRPIEDAAHSRMYAALVRVLQLAIGEARQTWVARAALLVEGLQRFLTYGVQASIAAAAPLVSSPSPASGLPQPTETNGGRYRPPHLRRRESQADGGLAWSDSDMSDTEHGGGASSTAMGSGAGSMAVVDKFRSARVRQAALTCIQAMAKGDPRAMHTHWSALLPLQNPLQPRPLTPHLITVLLYDPLTKVRALAAATISALLDGPAQRGILSVAEAKPVSARAPVRGFLTLSLTLGQLLLAAHTGLLHAVATESSMLVLPGVLRTLVVLIQVSPYERLPQELLPETFKVLQTRWAELTAAAPATASVRGGDLGSSQTAYLACLAECFSTKQPVAGLAAFLSQQQQHTFQDLKVLESQHGGAGCDSTQRLVRDLLAVGQDASAEAVQRIEALAALKGLAVNYTTALPPDVWDDLRATAAMGLSCIPAVRSPPVSRSGPPSRSSSWSSLGAVATHGASGKPGDRAGLRVPASQAFGPGAFPGAAAGGAVSQATSSPITPSANSSPEDKAAQLSVRLLSDYLSAIARQCDIILTDSAGAGSGDGGLPGLPPSPGFVPLAAAVARQHQQSLSPVCVQSEEQRKAGLKRLTSMWRDAVAVLVPTATSHQSYMVRSAGLSCLSEVPEPVFSSLTVALQQHLLTLFSDAAASDAVAAVRAAACKALGAAAVFPAVLETPQLSDHITRALLPSLHDAVLSVRIAGGWAIANLCDAYRRRLEALEAANGEGSDTEQQLRSRVDSHAHASTSSYDGGSGAVSSHKQQTLSLATLPLEPHHYRQLAALCGAAIISTQDTDKVRANGVRAVGNLLAFLTPDMAPGLMAAGAPS